MRYSQPRFGTIVLVEFLKLRRASALWVAAGVPAAVCALVTLSYLARPQLAGTPFWSWKYYLQSLRAIWGVFVFPALLAAVPALSVSLEHRHDNWKLQLAQPVTPRLLFWAKLIPLVALTSLGQIILYGVSVFLGRSLQLPGWPPLYEASIVPVSVVAALPVLALQYGLSLVSRSLLFPVGIGLLGHFLCLVSSEVPIAGIRPGYYLPWAYPMRALRISGNAVDHPLTEALIACCLAAILLWVVRLRGLAWERPWTQRSPHERRASVRHFAVSGVILVASFALLVGIHVSQRSLRAWLRTNAIRLAGPDRPDDSTDLKFLQDAVGGARIVLLGEASHGDGTTFLMKDRLVRFLHRRMGFDVLVFESGLFECQKASQEIAAGGDPVEWAERSIFGVWSQSAQVRPLIRYVGESYKEGHPLELAGFDMQPTGTIARDSLVTELRRFLERESPEVLRGKDWSDFSREIRELFDHPREWKAADRARHERTLRAVERVKDILAGSGVSGSDSEFWIRVLENVHEWVRLVGALGDQGGAGLVEAASIRERQMARNILWLARERFPDRKLLVWGATSHVSRNRQSIQTLVDPAMIPMGQTVWETFGTASYVVAFTCFEGRTGLATRDSSAEPQEIRIAPEGSIEDGLAGAGFDFAFLDLRRAPPNSRLRTKLPAGPMGHVPMKADWPRILDAMVFIRQMHPSDPATAKD